VSSTRSRPRRKGARYHHGDLREALIDTAVELIAERGVHGFSLSEASRRLGVTSAAPYRHFSDRDELLAAVLTDEASQAETREERVATMSRTYVHFAAEHRPLFETLLHSGIDKSRYPTVQNAYESVDALFLGLVQEICQGDEATADALAHALEATAHGHAVLLLDDESGARADATSVAGERAARAALALIHGRDALR
jgi:AcrR family transcriptional regulator